MSKKKAESVEAASALLRSLRDDLKCMGFGRDEDVSGADLVDVMGEYYDRIKRTLKHEPLLRVQTFPGLQPISLFDAVEVHPMVEHGEDGLIQASDDPLSTPCAFTVFLHLRKGGIETVRDFWFDPTEGGSMEVAAKEAADCAASLEDMLQVAGDAYPRVNYTAEDLVTEAVVSVSRSKMR